MYDWTQTLMATPDGNLPQVFSISWGWSEAAQCQIDKMGPCAAGDTKATNYNFVNTTNSQFMAVTARGVSFMVSSGDSGAHGRTDGNCATPMTHPDWPTASPWITAVGATQIANGKSTGPFTTPFCQKPTAGLPACATGGDEITCSTATGALISSGGGFSNVAPTPAWQSTAVSGYLASGAKLPPAGDFNSTGRGYPDVSALVRALPSGARSAHAAPRARALLTPRALPLLFSLLLSQGHNYIIWGASVPPLCTRASSRDLCRLPLPVSLPARTSRHALLARCTTLPPLPPCAVQKAPIQVDGTSCSAPVWGAIIGLVNAARLAAGKAVVGFANPAIYQLAASTPAAFHDVTLGDNSCSEQGCNGGKCTGFGATKGWDAATGYGSVDVKALVAAWAAL